MATTEKTGTMKYKDSAGNVTTMYPKTKTSQVEGLSDAIEEVKPFIVNVTGWTFGNGEGNLIEDAVADKTYSEAYAAYLAGKRVVMRANGRELSMLDASTSRMTFSSALPDAPDTLRSVDMTSAAWSSDGSIECCDALISIPITPNTAGLLKTNGYLTFSVAVAGTDYVTPDGMNTAIQSAIQNTWEASY